MTRSRRKNAGIVALFQIFPTQSWAFWRSELLPNFARSPLGTSRRLGKLSATQHNVGCLKSDVGRKSGNGNAISIVPLPLVGLD